MHRRLKTLVTLRCTTVLLLLRLHRVILIRHAMLLVLRCGRLVLLWLLAVELSLLVIYRQIRCTWRCLPHLTKLTYVVGGTSRWCCHH